MLEVKYRAIRFNKFRSSALLRKWNELVAMSQEQSNALEEARDLLNFNQLVERVLQWIKVATCLLFF